MHKLIIDTNVWIDWINKGVYETLLLNRDAVKYLSSIVLMELYAGAYKPGDLKRVDQLFRAFQRTNRIICPSIENYREAGNIMAKLQRQHGFQVKETMGLSHDTLIALTARTIGATLATSNRHDFELLQSLCSFHLQVV
jgi:predicted nucleic acid-binding protein